MSSKPRLCRMNSQLCLLCALNAMDIIKAEIFRVFSTFPDIWFFSKFYISDEIYMKKRLYFLTLGSLLFSDEITIL